MSYDLIPINKEVKPISFGMSWGIILQMTGAGYVIGYGEGRTPGSYVYVPDKRGASPMSNDGYKISSSEGKMMARVLRGYLSVQRFINKEWDSFPPKEQEMQKKVKLQDGSALYRKRVDDGFLKKIELLAEFAEQSKGFKIL